MKKVPLSTPTLICCLKILVGFWIGLIAFYVDATIAYGAIQILVVFRDFPLADIAGDYFLWLEVFRFALNTKLRNYTLSHQIVGFGINL